MTQVAHISKNAGIPIVNHYFHVWTLIFSIFLFSGYYSPSSTSTLAFDTYSAYFLTYLSL